jgi:hypothetical protein
MHLAVADEAQPAGLVDQFQDERRVSSDELAQLEARSLERCGDVSDPWGRAWPNLEADDAPVLGAGSTSGR